VNVIRGALIAGIAVTGLTHVLPLSWLYGLLLAIGVGYAVSVATPRPRGRHPAERPA